MYRTIACERYDRYSTPTRYPYILSLTCLQQMLITHRCTTNEVCSHFFKMAIVFLTRLVFR